MRLLATTTPEGVRKIQERDPILLRRFTVLAIEASTPDQTIEILRGIATRYEAHHKVQIGDPAIVAAVRLAKRYLQDRELPDSAIDLLDEAAARKRVELDGVPAQVDVAIRRLASLKAQRASLADDTDAMSVKTRERLDKRDGGPRAAGGGDARAARVEARARWRRRPRCGWSSGGSRPSSPRRATSRSSPSVGELEHVSIPEAKRKLEAGRSGGDEAPRPERRGGREGRATS